VIGRELDLILDLLLLLLIIMLRLLLLDHSKLLLDEVLLGQLFLLLLFVGSWLALSADAGVVLF